MNAPLKLTAVCSLALLASTVAIAQQKPDELMVGPLEVPHQFQGVTIKPSLVSYFAVATRPDGLYLNARVESDLRDLQNKFGTLIDTVPLPRDNCRSFSGNNPVVSLPSKQMVPDGDAARIKLSGEVKMWDCRENPIPETYWDPTGCTGTIPIINKKVVFGCPKTRKGSPFKTVLITQPFDFSVPVFLRKTGDRTAALVIGDPSVNLGGQLAFITKGVLNIAGVDLNAEAKKAIDGAIDPSSLTTSIPSEYAELNPVVQSARLGEKNGALTAFVELSAKIPASKLNEFVLSMVDGAKPKP